MRKYHKISAIIVGVMLFFSSCTPADLSVKIEEDLAEYCSITEENKTLISDAVQDIYAEAESEGVTLKVLQTITYKSMIYVLAQIDLGDIKTGKDGSIGTDIKFSFADRTSLGFSWNGIAEFDEAENSLMYVYYGIPKQQAFEKDNVMKAELTKVYRRIDLPPEAYNEDYNIKEGYEHEEILWQTEGPLEVIWEIENIGKSVELPIDDKTMVDGIIELNPMYLRVSANKSEYGTMFSDKLIPENTDWISSEYIRETFARSIKLKHKDGYYIDIFKSLPVNNCSENLGSFDVMKTFLMPLNMDAVDSVQIVGKGYKISVK